MKEQIKIIRCIGEGEKRQCEVVYLVNNKQLGNSFWLTTSAIQKRERPIKNLVKVGQVPPALKVRKPQPNLPLKKTPITATNPEKKSLVVQPEVKVPNAFAIKLQQAIENIPILKSIDSLPKIDSVKVDSLVRKEPDTDSLITPTTDLDSNKIVVEPQDTKAKKAADVPSQHSKLGVFIDCADCDMNYIRSELDIVNFLLDKNAADVHILMNQQPTGGGNSMQIIFYGQRSFRSLHDTLIINLLMNATEFERREEILRGIKGGLVSYLFRTPYAKFVSVDMNMSKSKSKKISTMKDPWDYWVFKLGLDGTFNSDQVYKSTEGSTDVSISRVTDKLRISFSGRGNYNDYKYTYTENGVNVVDKVINSDYMAEHSLVASMGSHWGIGYLASFSNSTFSNNKSRLYGKAAIEYSLFPYKDVNTRFITFSYGLDARANKYYDTTIYFKTEEILFGHVVQAYMAFNQKWGTLSSTISYRCFFADPALNNLYGKVSFDIRITGGLSFYFYTSGSRVRDQVFLVKGKASQQDVLTRRRQLASEYELFNGVGLRFRFGSKLNNFVNPRLEKL